MNVWTASHNVSTHGTLSATNSTRYSSDAMPMTHGLPKTEYSGGSATQPKYDARPTRATVAYRLTPAASENANVRPSTAKVSICVVLRLDGHKCFAVLSVVRRDRPARKTWGRVLESKEGHAFCAETSQAAAATGHLALGVRAGAGADASGCDAARAAAAVRLAGRAGCLAARRRSTRAAAGRRVDRRSTRGRPRRRRRSRSRRRGPRRPAD